MTVVLRYYLMPEVELGFDPSNIRADDNRRYIQVLPGGVEE
jgi:hypothetical protein